MPTTALSVLIVDDYADTAESFAVLLRQAGHDARSARSGAEALDFLPAWQPDVAILDWLMPDMDGIQLADRLRAIQRRPLLVAMTGAGVPRFWDRSDLFDYRFLKPVDPEALAELLSRHAAMKS